MNKKIALIIDSGTDVPADFLERQDVFVLPFRIIFSDQEYIDKVNITTKELFVKMEKEIPQTSLPTGEDVITLVNEVKSLGFTQALIVTVSSGLSGTNNAIRNIIPLLDGMEVSLFDTKNISIGSGLFAIQAAHYLDNGYTLAETVTSLTPLVEKTKIYFSVASLEYLKRGGRISSFAASLGTLLKILPIISCNEKGTYFPIAKVRGKSKCFEKIIELISDNVEPNSNFSLGITYGSVEEDMVYLETLIMEKLPMCKQLHITQVGPALAVHTGPLAFGVTIQTHNE